MGGCGKVWRTDLISDFPPNMVLSSKTDFLPANQGLPPTIKVPVWVRIFHFVSDLDTFGVGTRNSAAPAKDIAESLVGGRDVSIGISTSCTVGLFSGE